MIKLIWKQGESLIAVYGTASEVINIPVRCKVRSLRDGTRLKDYVAHTFPDKLAYDPDIFPKGKWVIDKPLKRTDDYKAPYFIPTDGFRMVEVWDEKNGEYIKPTGEEVRDIAYGMHHSKRLYSLGCIIIENRNDAYMLAWLLSRAQSLNEVCMLEVI